MHELLPLPNTSELQNTLFKGTRRHPLELVGKQWFSAKMPPKPPETKKSTRNRRAISRKVAQENQFSAQENQFSAQSRAILEFLEFLNNFQWFLLVADPASQKNHKKKGFPTNASDLFFSIPPKHIQQIVGKPKTLASKPISVVERQKLYVGKPKTL